MEPGPTPASSRSRRRHPRITIADVFVAQDLTLGHLVRLRDISRGGFRTEAACPVAPGASHTFRAALPEGDDCVMRATAIHCHPVVGPRSVCIVGWQASSDPVTVASLARLIDLFAAPQPEHDTPMRVGAEDDRHDTARARLTPA